MNRTSTGTRFFKLLSALVLSFCLLATVTTAAEAQGPDTGDRPSQHVPGTDLENAIINGDPIPEGTYPFLAFVQVSFMQGGEPRFGRCTGSLIDPSWVLTAAHCLYPGGATTPALPSAVAIGLGSVSTTSFAQVVGAADVVPHPLYDPTNFAFDDFALIRLAAPANVANPNIGVVELNTDPVSSPYGSTMTVMGWGDTTADPATVNLPSDALQTTMDVTACAPNQFEFEGQNICAFSTAGNGTCQGDSGGAAIQTIGGIVKVVGVTQLTPALCGGPPYSVFQRVSRHTSFIEDTLRPAAPSKYVALNPARILDTRAGSQVGQYSSPWSAGQTRSVDVTGVGGVPAGGVEAVALHVTSVSPSAQFSWLTVSPTGSPATTTAAHTFGKAGFTTEISNDLLVVKVGTGGNIDIFNALGSVEVVIDVVGYYGAAGSGYVALAGPNRIIDSRDGSSGPFSTPWGAGTTRAVTVTGVGGIPASGVSAVVMNITTINPTAAFSWLTVSPTGSAASTTAAHTFGTASYTTELVNDLVVAKVGTGGAIDILNALGSVDIIIDVVGYYPSSTGANYHPLTPQRILDTRTVFEGDYSTPWESFSYREIFTTLGSCTDAAVLHITTVDPTADFSWMTVAKYPDVPGSTAALNFGTSSTTTQLTNDLVVVPLGDKGRFNLANFDGQVDGVIDLVGYYGAHKYGDCNRPF